MKKRHFKFYAQMTLVSVLGVAGVIAISGEPAADANFLAVFIGQAAVCAVCWVTAWLLWSRCGLNRKARLF